MGWFKTLTTEVKRLTGRAQGQPPSAPAGSSEASRPTDAGQSSLGKGGHTQLVQSCPLPPRIVLVGFTDKPGAKALFGGKRRQYVNLTKEAQADRDTEISSKNQLRRTPPIHVKVTPAGSHTVHVRLVRTERRGSFAAGSDSLSTREAGLTHLQWDKAPETRTTDADGDLLLEPGLDISALAGFDYQVEASLDKSTWIRGSNTAEVVRRVYIRPIIRYASARRAAFDAISAVKGELANYDVEVVQTLSETGDELHIVEQSSLSKSLIDIGTESLSSSAVISDLRPHAVALIVGEFISSPTTETFESEFTKPAGGTIPDRVTIPLRRDSRVYVNVPLHDKSNLVKAEVTAGFFGLDSVELTAGELSGIDQFATSITIDLRRAKLDLAEHDTLTVELKLKALSGWAVGWAYQRHPIIYLNMLSPNTGGILSTSDATALVIHELGHKLHLAAAGDSGQPDKQPHHYPSFNQNGVAHTGPHCSTGVPSGTDLWSDSAQDAASCTMWGYLKGTKTFCSECGTALRKVDLSSGF